MSQSRKGNVIHVDKLVIHAKEVEIVRDRREDDFHRRRDFTDPWGVFWKRPHSRRDDEDTEAEEGRRDDRKDKRDS